MRRDSITPVAPDLWLSTGVSGSASVVQQMTNDLIDDLQDWLALSVSLPEVEREVIALLPPNRQQVVNVHVRYTGKAKPLISLDDIDVELDPD
jgi:hypothetical protein